MEWEWRSLIIINLLCCSGGLRHWDCLSCFVHCSCSCQGELTCHMYHLRHHLERSWLVVSCCSNALLVPKVDLILCNEREAPQVLYKLFDHHHHHLTLTGWALQAQRVDLIGGRCWSAESVFPCLAAAWVNSPAASISASPWRAGGLLSLAAPTHCLFQGWSWSCGMREKLLRFRISFSSPSSSHFHRRSSASSPSGPDSGRCWSAEIAFPAF